MRQLTLSVLRVLATQEMLCILQEFGEVTCCIGSSANIANTGIFLQADCRYDHMFPPSLQALFGLVI